ncbi:hypothetical protein [Cellulomonas alba]|uniref:Uncharacterized protein n=1 Tax=Cellulomonas alba TaxID=3053467 RepID=A0ABT7SDW8_9CELL|nr:hypothetical protein [Cellulomonas alba]MDM7854370.1 hypothetical protein [Cellulomonas alba]
MLPTALSAAEALAWRRRLPLAALRPGLALVMVAVCVASAVTTWSDDTWTDVDARGLGGALDSAAIGLVIASVAVLLVRPRTGVWIAALGSALCSIDPYSGGIGPAYAAVAIGCLVLGLIELVGAATQRIAARRWPVVVPDVDESTRAAMLRPRSSVLGFAGVCLVTATLGVGLWAHDDAATRAFRASASVGDGTVVAVDDDASRATVEVEGRRVHIPTDVRSYEVGDRVTVRYSPTGVRAEDLQNVFDPTGAVALLAIGLALGGTALGAEVRRRRAATALLRDGGPSAKAYAGEGPGWLPVLAGPGGPTLALLDVLAPADLVATDEGEPPLDLPGDLANATDGELLAAANALVDDPDDEDELVVVPAGAEVLVVGLSAYGDRPLVRVDGRWWRSASPARDPWLLRRWWRQPAAADDRRRADPPPFAGDALPSVPATTDAPPVLTARGAPIAQRSRLAQRWDVIARAGAGAVRRTPIAVPFLVGPAAIVPVVRWLGEALAFRHLVPLAGVALVGHAWVSAIRPRLRLAPAGLWVAGPITDELVPWSQVERVVADGSALVIRVQGDAVLLPVRRQSSPLLAGDPDPATAATRIEHARASAVTKARTSATPGRVSRGPDLAFLAGLLWASSAVGTGIAVLLGR